MPRRLGAARFWWRRPGEGKLQTSQVAGGNPLYCNAEKGQQEADGYPFLPSESPIAPAAYGTKAKRERPGRSRRHLQKLF
jgi:hypothetical protein